MLEKESLKPVIESLIFAADGAISFEKIFGCFDGEEKAAVREALKELIEDYRARSGGFLIEEVAGGYQFRTNPEFAPWLRKFFKIGMQKISKAAMESLAVIAYKQPVTRGEIEAIRGVDSGGVLATLMEKRFIKIVGRKEVPGRPVVYGTTKEFLETFDLKDLSCLPSLKDIQRMEEENAQEKAGQGAAEDAVQDAVQGDAGAEGGHGGEADEALEDSGGAPQASAEDGRREGPLGGEVAEGEAEDGSGEDWEETDPGRAYPVEGGTGPAEDPDEDGSETGPETGAKAGKGGASGAAGGEAPEDNRERGGDVEEEG